MVPQLDGDLVAWCHRKVSLVGVCASITGLQQKSHRYRWVNVGSKKELRTAEVPGELALCWRNLSQVCEKLKSQSRVFVFRIVHQYRYSKLETLLLYQYYMLFSESCGMKESSERGRGSVEVFEIC